MDKNRIIIAKAEVLWIAEFYGNIPYSSMQRIHVRCCHPSHGRTHFARVLAQCEIKVCLQLSEPIFCKHWIRSTPGDGGLLCGGMSSFWLKFEHSLCFHLTKRRRVSTCVRNQDEDGVTSLVFVHDKPENSNHGRILWNVSLQTSGSEKVIRMVSRRCAYVHRIIPVSCWDLFPRITVQAGVQQGRMFDRFIFSCATTHQKKTKPSEC